MIVEERKSKLNLIIEAASDLVRMIRRGINATPPDEMWKFRFAAITDLDIQTATEAAEYLEVSPENPPTYPYAAFFIDEVRPSVSAGQEHFSGSLGLLIGVQGETFAQIQREVFEIHHAVRGILLHHDSFGQYDYLGGVIDSIQWTGYSNPTFMTTQNQGCIAEVEFYFAIAFTEMLI